MNAEKIVDVILTDEKLFNYIMKLVKHRLNPYSLQDQNWLINVIDISIENALQEVQILDIINQYFSINNIKPENPIDQLDCIQLNPDESIVSEDNVLPNFSFTEPHKVEHISPKKENPKLTKAIYNPPPISASEFSTEPTGSKLVIDVDHKQEFSFGESEKLSSSSFHSVAESEASTVAMIVSPDDRYLTEQKAQVISNLQEEEDTDMPNFPCSPKSPKIKNSSKKSPFSLEDTDDVKAWESTVLNQLKTERSNDGFSDSSSPKEAISESISEEEEVHNYIDEEDEDSHDILENNKNFSIMNEVVFQDDLYEDDGFEQDQDSKEYSRDELHEEGDIKYPLYAPHHSYSNDQSPSYNGNQMIFFDQKQFDAEADAIQTGKPVKRVNFIKDIVTDVFYRDKTEPHEKSQMYYSHFEEAKFSRSQEKEYIKADSLGMSWNEYINQLPSDQSDSETEDEYYHEDYEF